MARLLIVEDSSELSSLIAHALTRRGHTARAEHTGQGALAALREEPADLAIVDLMLPDMAGREILAALRQRQVRAIAISGVYKGDRFALEATSVHGAAAFFEKPFRMERLLAEVDRLLGGPPIALPTQPPDAGDLEEEELVLEGLEPLPDDAEEVGAAPVPELPFADRARVWAADESPAPAPQGATRPLPAWTRAGNLSHTSVPRLLNAYYESRHTGELRLRQGNIVKAIHFESGRPVYAASNLLHERFGQFCARMGLLDGEQLAAVARVSREKKIRTAEAMISLGFLPLKRRRELLEEQIREIIWSTFVWAEGQYKLSEGRLPRTDIVKLFIFPGDLILDGVARTETLDSLKSHMPPERRLFPNAEAPYPLYELTLSGAQASLMAHADGTKTVADLLALTDLPEQEALSTLYGLELTGQLEERKEQPPRSRITFGL